MFGGFKKTPYLCTRLQKARAFSSAGLEHLPYKQRVGGSNPSTPTAPIHVKILNSQFSILNYYSYLCTLIETMQR